MRQDMPLQAALLNSLQKILVPLGPGNRDNLRQGFRLSDIGSGTRRILEKSPLTTWNDKEKAAPSSERLNETFFRLEADEKRANRKISDALFFHRLFGEKRAHGLPG
jgi:hypothetical protein